MYKTLSQKQVIYEWFSTGFPTNMQYVTGKRQHHIHLHSGPNHERHSTPAAGVASYHEPSESPWNCDIAMFRGDSDLEVFSHNPTDGSLTPVAPQPCTYTKCLNLRFLLYWLDATYQWGKTNLSHNAYKKLWSKSHKRKLFFFKYILLLLKMQISNQKQVILWL